MTIANATNRNDYTGNGATSVYAYSFKVFANTELVVTVRNTSDVETTLALTTDYTISGVGNTSGGNLTLVSSGQAWLTGGNLTTGFALTIRRVVPLTQTTDIRNQGDFYPEGHEDQFDKLVMADQQQQDEIDRSMKLPETISASSFDPTLPSATSDSGSIGKVIIINATNNGFDLGPTATSIGTASADSADALAARVAAEAAQTAAEAAQAAAEAAQAAAETAETDAETAETNAETAETNAAASEAAAGLSETNAAASEAAAAVSETNAAASEAAAGVSETNAAASETAAGVSETNAAASAASAATFATNVQTDTIDAGETIDLGGFGRVISFIAGTGGADAMSTTPFGVTVGDFVDGQEITMIGTDDTNFPTLADNDAQYGARLNGDISLTKGVSIRFVYSATLERFYESYRNN